MKNMEDLVNFFSGLDPVQGVETLISLAVFLIGVPAAIWWWTMPRYTAVCCHDGTRWVDLPGSWSAARGVAGRDLEQFTKQWLGQALTGRFVTAEQARIPVNPKARRHHIQWFGRHRGFYYVVGVRLFDEDLLQRFPERLRYAPVRFEREDEYLPLR